MHFTLTVFVFIGGIWNLLELYHVQTAMHLLYNPIVLQYNTIVVHNKYLYDLRLTQDSMLGYLLPTSTIFSLYQ